MVTAHIPIGYEYEQNTTPKIVAVGTTHTLLAGDVLRNPGVVIDNTAIGAFLIENSYSPSLGKDKVLRMVRDAKTRSEIAPGVGTRTTELVIPIEESD